MLRAASALSLTAVLLADVAPVGSCGNNRDRRRVSVTFVLSAGDCSCLPATVDVIATGMAGAPPRVEIRCGATTFVPMSVRLEGTLHVSEAGQSARAFADMRYSASDGEQVTVRCSCPSR